MYLWSGYGGIVYLRFKNGVYGLRVLIRVLVKLDQYWAVLHEKEPGYIHNDRQTILAFS